MEKKIITISREFGSGGRTMGRKIAEKLGIPFYDKELVEQVALESGFAPSLWKKTASTPLPAPSCPMPSRPRGSPGS